MRGGMTAGYNVTVCVAEYPTEHVSQLRECVRR